MNDGLAELMAEWSILRDAHTYARQEERDATARLTEAAAKMQAVANKIALEKSPWKPGDVIEKWRRGRRMRVKIERVFARSSQRPEEDFGYRGRNVLANGALGAEANLDWGLDAWAKVEDAVA